MRKLTTSEAREAFSEIVNLAAFSNERVVLTRHGKELAALISIDELERLRALDKSEKPAKPGRRKKLTDEERKRALEDGRAALRELQAEAKQKGLDKLSEDEINALVAVARKARRRR